MIVEELSVQLEVRRPLAVVDQTKLEEGRVVGEYRSGGGRDQLEPGELARDGPVLVGTGRIPPLGGENERVVLRVDVNL